MAVLVARPDRAVDLTSVLAARGDPMAACRRSPWLKRYVRVPRNAAPPLAMSAPHPRATGSYGPECIAWAKRELGITLRWWQALAICRQLEHDRAGVLVWRELVESGPRRIGKSTRLRVVALWRTANAERIGEKQLTMLVSKDLAIGKEIHRGSWRWAERKDWKVVRLNGGQEVEAPDESRWLLRADTAVYGYDVGYGQVDESWNVDPQSISDGLEPALLERLWPQLHLTSTAHVRASSLMRRRLVAALRSADQDVLLLLWGAPPGADYSDERVWRAASPHWTRDRRDLVARKYAAALAGEHEPEFDDPDPVRGWAAQYLNVWPLLLGRGQSIFPQWADRVAELSELDGETTTPRVLGLAADVRRTVLHLGASDGRMVWMVTPKAFAGPSVRMTKLELFLDELERITSEHDVSVALQEKGPAWFLVPKLEDRGIPVTPVPFEGFVQAGADMEQAVIDGSVSHPDDPVLTAAVEDAEWRTVNDRQVLSRKADDISALEAAALARWAAVRGPDYDVMDSAW